MSFLSFLKSAKVKEVEEKKVGNSGGPRKQRNPNPTFLGIRLWKDGSVFPSQAAVDKFKLEYGTGTYETIPAIVGVGVEGQEGYVAAKPARRVFKADPDSIGNGFDIIDSRSWDFFKGDGNLLFLGVVPKNEPKVSLFGSTKYDAEGKPLKSVMEQGSATFGKEVLIPAVQEIYGIEFNDEKEFVDLQILDEVEGININKQFGRNIIFSPKKVVRGADAGKADYERRENMALYALVPTELLGTQSESETKEMPSHIDTQETIAQPEMVLSQDGVSA